MAKLENYEVEQLLEAEITAKWEELRVWQIRANFRPQTYRESVEAKTMCNEIQNELKKLQRLLYRIMYGEYPKDQCERNC